MEEVYVCYLKFEIFNDQEYKFVKFGFNLFFCFVGVFSFSNKILDLGYCVKQNCNVGFFFVVG